MAWHNLTKGQSADRILKLWKSCVYDYRPSNMQLLKFWLFNFSNLQTTFIKDFRKKNPGFKIYVGSTDKGLPIQQYLWSEISRQWNNSILIFFFFKFARKSVLLLTFCQMRGILKPWFCWYFWNLLLWVVLMELNVSQVGCF